MERLKRLILSTFALELFLLSRGVAGYIWPIDGKILLNSNFAECRPNHFHAGIDINAEEGTPVKAIADGFIWHISVSPFGYGKSLFLKLNDGRIIVYAHLSSFSTTLENLVELKQRKNFSYRVSLYFKKGRFNVKKGEVIGYVGRTGTNGSHLHFEMRDMHNRPINPLLYGYHITDTTPPIIKAIQIVPLDEKTYVNCMPFPVIIKPHFNGIYYSFDDTVYIKGKVGLEVLTEDYQNKHSMRLNIQRLEMYVNGRCFFRSEFNKFSYKQTREVELEFDYDLYNKGIGRFHRLFLYGDNNLSFYEKQGGIINIAYLSEVNEIKIVSYDANKNRAVAIFYLSAEKRNQVSRRYFAQDYSDNKEEPLSFFRNCVMLNLANTAVTKITKLKNAVPVFSEVGCNNRLYFRLLPKKKGLCSIQITDKEQKKLFEFHYSTVLKDEGGVIVSPDKCLLVGIEKNTLYENLYMRIQKIKAKIPDGLKLIKGPYQIEPIGAVFKKEINIIFPYPYVSVKKLGIYKKQRSGWAYIGNIYDESKGAIIARARHLGIFALFEDNVSPKIDNFKVIKENHLIKGLSFNVKDTGAGFKTSDIHISIDGVPRIPVYDPYRDRVSFLLFGEKIPEGGHTAEISVTDRAGNKSSISVSF